VFLKFLDESLKVFKSLFGKLLGIGEMISTAAALWNHFDEHSFHISYTSQYANELRVFIGYFVNYC
jgi:hypothetical protein